MSWSQVDGELPLKRQLVLCFRTEEQGRALAAAVCALGSSFASSCEFLYCRPPGFAAADALEPWLDELMGAVRARCGLDVFARTAVQDVEKLLIDFRLRADAAVCVATDPADPAATRWAYRLLGQLPCDGVLVHGRVPGELGRVLLGAESGQTRAAATHLAAVIANDAGADVFAVAPVPPHRRAMNVIRQLDQITETARSLFDVRTYQSIVPGRSRDMILLAACKAQRPDVVVAGLQRGGIAGEFAAPRIPQRLLARCPVPVILVSTPVRPALQRLASASERVFDVLPTLSVAQRTAIYAQVRRSARADADFLFMIVAAASLAALGLRLDSAVVIIGAMLVAPLMSPIVAVGLAVAQGDGRLLTMAARSVARGALTALAAAFVLGLVLPGGTITTEMVKRAHPSLLDLAVAVASGGAGAYALSRKGVSSSLPGVAIAVSLVPPLATTGLALAMGAGAVASGSLLLFLVNLAAVATASGLMFVWMGFSPEAGHAGRRRTFGKGVAGLGVMLVAVTAPLAWNAVDSAGGPPVDAVLQRSLEEGLDDGRSWSLLSVESERDGDTVVVLATIAADRAPRRSEVAELQAQLEGEVGETVALTVRTELTATAEPD